MGGGGGDIKGRRKRSFLRKKLPHRGEPPEERRRWAIQSRPAGIRDSHPRTCLSIPPTTGPSTVPGLRGMELPSPTPSPTGRLQKAPGGSCRLSLCPRRWADGPHAVPQRRESNFHPGRPMGEQAGCDRTQEGGRKPELTQAASWQGCSARGSSQEPRGVVRQKVASKHLHGPAASGLRALASGPEAVQRAYLPSGESEDSIRLRALGTPGPPSALICGLSLPNWVSSSP